MLGIDIPAAVAHFRQEFDVIASTAKGAPVLCTVTAGVVLLLGYLVAEWHFGGVIETQKATIELKNTQLASRGLPPTLNQRVLTSEQKRQLAAAIKRNEAHFPGMIIFAMADAEPRQYAKQFAELFESLGIEVVRKEAPSQMGDVGLMIGVGSTEQPTENAKAFQEALKAAGISARYTIGGVWGKDINDFDLFVGPTPW
jgi:hypothetical protein